MSRQLPRALALAGLLVIGLTACGETDSTGAAPTSTPSATADPTSSDEPTPSDDNPTSTEEPMPSGTHTPPPGEEHELPTGPVPDAVLERSDVVAAIEEHAERKGVSVDDVTVAGFADVTWSDGSIGCPEPGMMYTQALVPGHQLILSVDGELASYHAATGRPFFYCATPVPPTPGINPNT